MDDDARYARACKIALAAAAGVHWVGTLLLLSQRFDNTSTWEYSRSVRRFALAVVQALVAG